MRQHLAAKSDEPAPDSATALSDDPSNPLLIDVVSTSGYRFISSEEERRPVVGWALVCGGVLALFLAAAIWYMNRPLSPPKVTGYTQITHDGRQKTLVGTDGSRLYFNRMSGPTTFESVAQIAISGGGTAPISVALPNPFLVDVSPNGSSFLIGADTGIWNVPILGGQARHLSDADDASFSPDGNSVAFSPKDGAIYVVGSDGTGTHKLAHAGDTVSGTAWSSVSDIAWSPDGDALRYHEGPDLGDVVERIGASRGDARLAQLLP